MRIVFINLAFTVVMLVSYHAKADTHDTLLGCDLSDLISGGGSIDSIFGGDATCGGDLISGGTGVIPTIPPPVSSVPVPAAAWLFGSGLVGLVMIGRRRS